MSGGWLRWNNDPGYQVKNKDGDYARDEGEEHKGETYEGWIHFQILAQPRAHPAPHLALASPIKFLQMTSLGLFPTPKIF